MQHHKSRFLAAADGGLWVESVPGAGRSVDSLMATGQAPGVSFKNSLLRVVFASPVLRRDPARALIATSKVEALLLAFPTELKEIQRRNAYRATATADAGLSARVWRMNEFAYIGDRPSSTQEVTCELRDISTGGLGVVFHGKDGQPPLVSAKDRLRIELATPGGKILIEGRMRYPTHPIYGIRAWAGVQFKAMDADIDGRQTLALLTRIVGELQRDEVRRLRLGLCQPQPQAAA